jgi:hydroxyacylglutathione hydrolase
MSEKLIHEIIPVGMLQCNCSILGDPVTREAIVVDPGDDVERVLEILAANQLKVRAIVSTHTHIDHVGGLAGLRRATGAPVLIHEADLELYRHLDVQAQFLGTPTPESTKIEDFVKEGDTLRWGDYSARVIHTPGHTPGSISLFIEQGGKTGGEKGAGAARSFLERQTPGPATATAQASLQADLEGHSYYHHFHAHSLGVDGGPSRLVAGDTLFQGSIGRTDLWGGSMNDILRSLREKLMKLPDETIVIPGHGESTTIGEEREYNPYLK